VKRNEPIALTCLALLAIAGCRPEAGPPAEPAAETLRYRVVWQARTTAALPLSAGDAGGFDATFTLDADLLLQRRDRPGGETELLARFDAVRLFELEAQGEPMTEAADASLLRHSAAAVFGPGGELATIAHTPGAGDPFRAVMGGLLETVRFVRGGGPADRPAGQGTLELTADGLLAHLDEERVTSGAGTLHEAPDLVTSHKLAVILEERAAASPWATAFEAPIPAKERADLLDPERRIAAAFAEGLTPAGMSAALMDVSRGLPVPRGMVRRMTGLVRSDDDAARVISDLATRGLLEGDGLSLAADVLASAGTPVAQGALEALLSASLSRETSGFYGLLVQRFSLVRRPTESAARFVESERRRAAGSGDVLVARAALVTAGSVVARLHENGDEDLAAEIETRLLGEPPPDAPIEDVEAYLAALGNLARPQRAADILRRRAHPSVAIRAQVAISLRKIADPAARAALLELAADPEVEVASRALDSLAASPVPAEELEALVTAVERDEISVSAYGSLRNLLAGMTGDAALRARALRHMISRLPPGTQRQNLSILLSDVEAGMAAAE